MFRAKVEGMSSKNFLGVPPDPSSIVPCCIFVLSVRQVLISKISGATWGPGWKVCQLRTECQETDNILRTKNEINVRTKIKIEIARDGPLPIFYDNVL